jgi:O-methyltransferase
MYLDLLKGCLTRYLFEGEGYRPVAPTGLRAGLVAPLMKVLASRRLILARPEPFDRELRTVGGDWPAFAETMIGLRRLDNLQTCIANVLEHKVPGDLIETGVWRGGATIFMRAMLKVREDTSRRVWVADSFRGLPKPDPRYPADIETDLSMVSQLAVSLDTVKSNFARYGLLDDQVCFIEGWFRDTLPTAPIDRLSILRLDGDLYESTMDALTALYPKLSAGGYVIVDDYGIRALGCRQAVDEFRADRNIDDQIEAIDGHGVFWQKGH